MREADEGRRRELTPFACSGGCRIIGPWRQGELADTNVGRMDPERHEAVCG